MLRLSSPRTASMATVQRVGVGAALIGTVMLTLQRSTSLVRYFSLTGNLHRNSTTSTGPGSKRLDVSSPGENARIYGDVRADATVQCNDRNNCTGFFEYSPPDRSPNATQLQRQEVAAYSYGNDKQLFFPNHTHPSVKECVSQWDGESEKWRERGMSTYNVPGGHDDLPKLLLQ